MTDFPLRSFNTKIYKTYIRHFVNDDELRKTIIFDCNSFDCCVFLDGYVFIGCKDYKHSTANYYISRYICNFSKKAILPKEMCDFSVCYWGNMGNKFIRQSFCFEGDHDYEADNVTIVNNNNNISVLFKPKLLSHTLQLSFRPQLYQNLYRQFIKDDELIFLIKKGCAIIDGQELIINDILDVMEEYISTILDSKKQDLKRIKTFPYTVMSIILDYADLFCFKELFEIIKVKSDKTYQNYIKQYNALNNDIADINDADEYRREVANGNYIPTKKICDNFFYI